MRAKENYVFLNDKVSSWTSDEKVISEQCITVFSLIMNTKLHNVLL